MNRARTLALVVLMLSYGAVGARQPAVRTSAALGVPVARLAETLGIADPDRSHIVLDVVRIAFDAPDGQDAGDTAIKARLQALFRSPNQESRDTVPLPLDPSVWRDTILRRQVPDNQLIPAILSERTTALLYHGLAALDDETLGALGPDRETLEVLRRHAGTFATFGRSFRIHAGRVVVPGRAPRGAPLAGARRRRAFAPCRVRPPASRRGIRTPGVLLRRALAPRRAASAVRDESAAARSVPPREDAGAARRVRSDGARMATRRSPVHAAGRSTLRLRSRLWASRQTARWWVRSIDASGPTFSGVTTRSIRRLRRCRQAISRAMTTTRQWTPPGLFHAFIDRRLPLDAGGWRRSCSRSGTSQTHLRTKSQASRARFADSCPFRRSVWRSSGSARRRPPCWHARPRARSR